MVNLHLRNHKLILFFTMLAILTIIGTLAAESFYGNRYQQLASEQRNSNLTVKGVVTSIKTNFKAQGISSEHIFRYYVTVNITEVLWVREDLASWINFSKENNTINGNSVISVGYDKLDDLQLAVGQTVECSGYYVSHTDSPFSYKITVAPNISGSYLKVQT